MKFGSKIRITNEKFNFDRVFENVEEAASFLKVSRGTLYNALARKGRLKDGSVPQLLERPRKSGLRLLSKDSKFKLSTSNSAVAQYAAEGWTVEVIDFSELCKRFKHGELESLFRDSFEDYEDSEVTE